MGASARRGCSRAAAGTGRRARTWLAPALWESPHPLSRPPTIASSSSADLMTAEALARHRRSRAARVTPIIENRDGHFLHLIRRCIWRNDYAQCARRERPRRRPAECSQQFPPSDGDCHTPLPCEVRKRKDTTSRACSLHVQGGQDAGCCRPASASKAERLSFSALPPKATG